MTALSGYLDHTAAPEILLPHWPPKGTRIAAAREAGIDVKATVRGFDDLLSASEIKRFTIPKKGFVPKTWGEAITGRINKQTGGFSKENPYGASQPPRITGRE